MHTLNFILLAAGRQSFVIGSITYLAIKLIGYSFAASYLNHTYDQQKSTIIVGLIRTLIGVIIGTLYYLMVSSVFNSDVLVNKFLLLILIPVRYFEWWLVIKLFYKKEIKFGYFTWGILGLIIFSFVLDLPTIFGVIIIGGFWCC